MADDVLDGMFPVENQVAEPAPAVEAPETAPPAEVPAKEPEAVEQPEGQVEQKPEVTAPERPEPGYVPIAAVMDERDKRKALEARLAKFESEQQKPQRPDPDYDPVGFADYQSKQFQSALQQQRVDMSWTLAVRDYGKDVTEAAKQWAMDKAQGDPIFGQQLEVAFQTETLPIDWLVQQHKRDALLTDIGDPSKLDDWFEREAAKRGYAMQSVPVAVAPVSVAATPQPAPKPQPPKSIASDASTGSTQSQSGSFNVFDGLLKR